MTIIDLDATDKNLNSMTCDICIIGAGAGGLYLSRRLADRGLNVVVLEAGGKTCAAGESIGIVTDLTGARYGGVIEGRAFGLGGTTSQWGGQLIPHSELDRRSCDAASNDIWSQIIAIVQKWGGSVESALGLGAYVDYFSLPENLLGKANGLFLAHDLQVLASLWLPFRHRNLRYLIDTFLKRNANLTVILHAVASNWRVAQSRGRNTAITSVTASSISGKSIDISAHSYVIAAGAVESTRILLEIDRKYAIKPFHGRSSIGKFLSDHLSCSVAQVKKRDAPAAIKMFGPYFVRGMLRSLRFVDKTLATDAPRHFFHFHFNNDSPGFGLARKILSGMQSGLFPDIKVKEVVEGIAGIAGLAYGRIYKSRLYIPVSSPINVQIDIEQAPSSENFVSIGDKIDAYGRPNAIVNWKIGERDVSHIQEAADRFFRKWPGGKCGIPLLKPDIELALSSSKPYGVYHPVGTCRMGTDLDAVVDIALRVRGCDNLSMLSTAVFPTAGTANPTFSLLCMAEDIADRVVREIDEKRR